MDSDKIHNHIVTPENNSSNDTDTDTQTRKMTENSDIVEQPSELPMIITDLKVNDPPIELKDAPIPDEPKNESTPVMKSARKNLHKYFLYTLVGGLVILALISIFAVLIGELNSTITRSLAMTGSMVIHTLIILPIVSIPNKNEKINSPIVNIILLLSVASFITSIFFIWDILTGQIVIDLYKLYFYSFCVSLWIQLLLNVGSNLIDKQTHLMSNIAIGITVIFYLLLIPTVFTHYPDTLPEFEYRAMTASVIALATVSVLMTIFHRIYISKHPEIKLVPFVNNGRHIRLAVITIIVGIPLIIIIISIVLTMSYKNIDDTYNSKYETSALDNPDLPTGSQEGDQIVEQVYKDPICVKESEQSKHPELPPDYVQFYIYNESSEYSISTRSMANYNSVYDISVYSTPIYSKYTPSLAVFDSECQPININNLTEGDKVRLYYMVPENGNNNKEDLAIIQRLSS